MTGPVAGIVIWGAVAIAAMIAAAIIAGQKNRNQSYWTAWCFVFPPLVIVLALLGPKEVSPRKRRAQRADDEDEIEDILDADR